MPVYTGVDLGLPSGTIWATTNVRATEPWEYGDYFAWGEVEGLILVMVYIGLVAANTVGKVYP